MENNYTDLEKTEMLDFSEPSAPQTESTPNNEPTSDNEPSDKEEKKTDKSKIIIAALILLLFLMGGAVVFLFLRKPEVIEIQAQNGSVTVDTRSNTDAAYVEGDPLANRQVYLAGINDANITTRTQIALENLKENEEILIKYIVTDDNTGAVLFTTDMIPSGQHVLWTPGETMQPGEYRMNFKQIPYYPYEDGSYEELTSGTNQVRITIKPSKQ